MRFAVLTNAPMPYRVPVFERLGREDGAVARFFFDGGPELASSISALPFDAERIGSRLVLRRPGYEPDEPVSMRLGFGYLQRLAAFRPDVVITGEFGWRTLHAASYAAIAGVPLLIWWEGTASSDGNIGRVRNTLRRWLAGRAAGLLGFGRGAVAYLESIAPAGMPIHFVPQAVDNERIAREVDRWRADRNALRASMGIQGTALICVGQLVRRKGIRELLPALQRLRAATPAGAFTLLLAGDGLLRPEAERAAKALGGQLRVLGAVPPAELPRYLAAADLMVFPTRKDCWGMVVNEALAAGLPVLGSQHAGACDELLLHDGVGARFDPLDPTDFDAALHAAVVEGRWRDAGTAVARRAVTAHTCEAAAEALLAAARGSLAGRRVPSLA
jgi:glycosyltransferase involved in cell wall biosynthesis